LPAGIPVSVFANNIYVTTFSTQNAILIGESESGTIIISIPETVSFDFELKFIVDQGANGLGIQKELSETNNSFSEVITLFNSAIPPVLENLVSCNLGLGKGIFDLSVYENVVKNDPDDEVQFYQSLADAKSEQNAITNSTSYEAIATPQEIFIRVNGEFCFTIIPFLLQIKNCPPKVYNLVTANNDGDNDTFYIAGLRNIFTNFTIEVYNRWGNLVWEGSNQTEDWNGFATKGPRIMGDKVTPGTYYYILNLNDPDYKQALTGFIHVTN
jgi:gliding motility-associated-like protein